MTEPTTPYLRAYYHEFTPTGCPAVDGILEAIALAGKAYHETADWDEAPQHGPDGYWSLIQRRADAAAESFKTTSILPEEPPADWLNGTHPLFWGFDERDLREILPAVYAALRRAIGGKGCRRALAEAEGRDG